jgi:hypothetical protein
MIKMSNNGNILTHLWKLWMLLLWLTIRFLISIEMKICKNYCLLVVVVVVVVVVVLGVVAEISIQ